LLVHVVPRCCLSSTALLSTVVYVTQHPATYCTHPRPACLPTKRLSNIIDASLVLVDHTNSDNLTCPTYSRRKFTSLGDRGHVSRLSIFVYIPLPVTEVPSPSHFFILHHHSRCMKVC